MLSIANLITELGSSRSFPNLAYNNLKSGVNLVRILCLGQVVQVLLYGTPESGSTSSRPAAVYVRSISPTVLAPNFGVTRALIYLQGFPYGTLTGWGIDTLHTRDVGFRVQGDVSILNQTLKLTPPKKKSCSIESLW